jgi:uncharacterized SAM-binding protein YcdF (DUF218 family)
MTRLPRWHGWRAGSALLALGFSTMVAAWFIGFLGFIAAAERPVPPPPRADGVVALTGGAERVEAALRLLAEDRAQNLLISGTGSGADLTVLAHRAGLDPAPLAERVTLGRSATSTRGNALETASWVQAHDIRTLIVVTAYYHMPRALTELRRTLPNVQLYAYPVLSPDGFGAERLVSLRLLVEEYSKYLLAAAGVTAWEPTRDAVRGGHAV